MPATFTTKEKFRAGTKKARMDREVELRIKAGAIRSSYDGSEESGWVLETLWNVIGEQ